MSAERALLVLLDGGLSVLHVTVVLGVLTLWIPKATRRLHLLLVGVTAVSWLGLGLIHGVGYCFLTDWQWEVKRWRGEASLPRSFIHYALTRWFGLSLRATTSDVLTGVGFGLAACLSLVVNLAGWLRRFVVTPQQRKVRALRGGAEPGASSK